MDDHDTLLGGKTASNKFVCTANDDRLKSGKCHLYYTDCTFFTIQPWRQLAASVSSSSRKQARPLSKSTTCRCRSRDIPVTSATPRRQLACLNPLYVKIPTITLTGILRSADLAYSGQQCNDTGQIPDIYSYARVADLGKTS